MEPLLKFVSFCFPGIKLSSFLFSMPKSYSNRSTFISSSLGEVWEAQKVESRQDYKANSDEIRFQNEF